MERLGNFPRNWELFKELGTPGKSWTLVLNTCKHNIIFLCRHLQAFICYLRHSLQVNLTCFNTNFIDKPLDIKVTNSSSQHPPLRFDPDQTLGFFKGQTFTQRNDLFVVAYLCGLSHIQPKLETELVRWINILLFLAQHVIIKHLLSEKTVYITPCIVWVTC